MPQLRMNRAAVLVLTTVLVAIVIPVVAGALSASALSFNDLFGAACDDSVSGDTTGATACQDPGTSNPITGPDGALTVVANFVAFAVGFAAVIVIIISGISYMTSQGDSAKVQTAKNTIIYASIGLILAILARFIIGFVVTKVA